MAAGLSRPWWWKGDWDPTGKTQLGWAKKAAAEYRESVTDKGVTDIVTDTAAERKRRWRERNLDRAREIDRAAKARQRASSASE